MIDKIINNLGKYQSLSSVLLFMMLIHKLLYIYFSFQNIEMGQLHYQRHKYTIKKSQVIFYQQ
ncbi:unnamed protein product [Paramecium sonneborni]|uniref:Uncharacterized protein n=1 Tax=Paramecium sonneborni TaxID=65129 RepID=A0A8S1QNW7_9CILI|nr:unnamed protein product [Paramecium sonneborni]